MSIKLSIFDDQEVIRAGLANFLAGTEIRIVGSSGVASEALKQAFKHKPDVVLLEFRLQAGDGVYVLKKIRARLPDTQVIIFTAHDNPAHIVRANELGAADYLLKSCSKEALIDAIKSAAKGHGPIRAGEMRRVAYDRSSALHQEFEDLPLTPREMEVLRNIALGHSNKEIAHLLEISVETVKEHVQSLLKKLCLTSRTQAAVLAVRKGVN